MVDERRQDIGYKVTITVLVGVVSVILSLFINSTFSMANDGRNLGIENSKNITHLQASLIAMHDDLTEIKELLKRKVPQ